MVRGLHYTCTLRGVNDRGLQLIQIEMPSASSPVNVYLVLDSPLTLVDTGPNLTGALTQLERGLREHGVQVQDLERIVITHPHIDHFGLARILRDRSGAEVWAPAGSEPWLGRFHENGTRINEWQDALMVRHGVPPGVVASQQHGAAFRNSWDPSVPVDRALADGDTIGFDNREWLVALRPGHSPLDLVFHDEHRGQMILGDHLIDYISSNPVITPVPGREEQGRPTALLDYCVSMRKTYDMSASLGLSGHGGPIYDHRALIEKRLGAIDRRTEVVGGLVHESPRSAHSVAREIWGERAASEAWLTLSEVLGHVDRLSARGLVREVQSNTGAVVLEPAN